MEMSARGGGTELPRWDPIGQNILIERSRVDCTSRGNGVAVGLFIPLPLSLSLCFSSLSGLATLIERDPSAENELVAPAREFPDAGTAGGRRRIHTERNRRLKELKRDDAIAAICRATR